MSGIDEQVRIGIACQICGSKGSFVFSDSFSGLDVHVHGKQIYISSTKNTEQDSPMLLVPVGKTPHNVIRNTEWTSIISRCREIYNHWTCKHCGCIIDKREALATWDDICSYIGGYHFYRMIYIGEKEPLDKLYSYESDMNVRH